MSNEPNTAGPKDDNLLDDVNRIVRSISETSNPLSTGNGSQVLGNRDSFVPIKDTYDEDNKNVDRDIRDYIGFMYRAQESRRYQEANQLITAQVTDQLKNGLLPEIKELVVPDHSKVFLFSEQHAPISIPPGKHDVSRLGLGGGLDQSKKAFLDFSDHGSNRQKSSVLICEVRTGVFSTTITLPDWKGFVPIPASRDPGSADTLEQRVRAYQSSENYKSDPAARRNAAEHLASELGRVFQEARLMTNDNIAVGVRLQLEIEVIDAEQIVKSYFRYYTKWLEQKYTKLDEELKRRQKDIDAQPRDPGLLRGLGYTWIMLNQYIFGAARQSAPCPPPIAFSRIYNQHRLEFADAVRDVIRQEQAVNLIERPAEVRGRIIPQIESHMSSSLRAFGLGIRRIVSVECIAPDYNRLMSNRGRLKLRSAEARDGFEQAAVEEIELQVESKRFQDQLRHQADRAGLAKQAEADAAILRLREASRVMDQEDAVLLKLKERERREAEYARTQKLLDADADARIEDRQNEVQRRKMESLLQVDQSYRENMLRLELQAKQDEHNRLQDALNQEHRREQERIKTQFQHLLDTKSQEMTNRLQWLEKFAGLSATTDEGKMLVMALACDPRLAKPYAEAARAKSKDELNQKLIEFKDQLVAVHGKQDTMVNELFQQGVKSIGQVLGKMAERPDQHTHYGSTWQVPPSPPTS